MTTPARKTQLPVLHQISLTVDWNDPAAATGQLVGVLPAGAVLDKSQVLTNIAFNGTTSVVLSVGTTLTGTDIVNATDVRTAIARVDTVVPAAKAGPLAVDTPIYASVVFGGTIGTAGQAQVLVTFHPIVG